jgi:hypothetical protein
MTMRTRLRATGILIVLLIAAAGVAWLQAVESDDDRPPIIVRGGSIYFQGGVPESTNPVECCNDWQRDHIGEQWKPKPDDKSGVRALAVTVTGVAPGACTVNNAESDEVLIDYYANNETTRFRVYLKAKFGFPHFGRIEPKIDFPKAPKYTPGIPTDPRNKAGRLEFGKDGEGWISGLSVAGQRCDFVEAHKPTLVIRIQPKTIKIRKPDFVKK